MRGGEGHRPRKGLGMVPLRKLRENSSHLCSYPPMTVTGNEPIFLVTLTYLHRKFLKFLSPPPMDLSHFPNEISCLVYKLQALVRGKNEKIIGAINKC